MALSSKSESVVTRYAPYVEELQEFFSLRGLQFGYPDNIFALAERLSSGGFFREEMSSMIRAVIYRECEGITRDDLLELIAVASGGPRIRFTSETYEEPVETILEFLGRVFHSLWRTFPDSNDESELEIPVVSESKTEDEIAAPQPFAAPEPFVAPQPFVAPADPLPEDAVEVPAAAINSEPSANAPSLTSFGMFSHALTISNEGQDSTRSIWRPVLLVAAVCAVLLALFPGVLFGHRSRSAAVPASTALDAAQSPLPVPFVPASVTPTATTSPGSDDFQSASDQDIDSIDASAPVEAPAPRTKAETRSGRQRARQPVTSESGESTFYSAPAESLSPRSRHGEQGVFFVSSGVMTGNLLSAPAPDYPKLASLTHVEGPVILQIVVAPDGTVSATRVLRGHWLLRSAAEHAIRRWRYRPYRINGRATDIATIVTVDFRLRH